MDFSHGSTREKGTTGEEVSSIFLRQKGFRIIARNYLKKWGEIDIAATKDGHTHFFEVKSVLIDHASQQLNHSPEENVHGLKIRRLRRIIETFLVEKMGRSDVPFHFHVLCVHLNMRTRRARVRWLRNIVL